MTRACIVGGAILGALSVAGGAFGAHGLRATLEAAGHAATWETAFRYALVHAVALVATGLVAALPACGRPRAVVAAGVCFAVGTTIFSGCLAALALTDRGVLGAIVPVGGALLIGGWVLLAVGATGIRQR